MRTIRRWPLPLHWPPADALESLELDSKFDWAAGLRTAGLPGEAGAAPFFRIFNPVSQGTKFDPNGDYVRRWVPELAQLPADWIHRPGKRQPRF